MQKEFYDKLAAPYVADESKAKRLNKVNSAITRAFYAIYPILLVILIIMRDPRIIRCILVPTVGFIGVTIFRKLMNAPRPYEVWDINQVIPKDKKGHSFPSRHVFSLYIITMAVSYVCWPIAIVLAIVGVGLAWARVVGGVHFVKDVTAGAVMAVVIGIIGFWII